MYFQSLTILVAASPAHRRTLRLRSTSLTRLPQPGLRFLSQRLMSVGGRTDHLRTSRYSYRHVSRTLKPQASPRYSRARPIDDQAECCNLIFGKKAPVPHLTTWLRAPYLGSPIYDPTQGPDLTPMAAMALIRLVTAFFKATDTARENTNDYCFGLQGATPPALPGRSTAGRTLSPTTTCTCY